MYLVWLEHCFYGHHGHHAQGWIQKFFEGEGGGDANLWQKCMILANSQQKCVNFAYVWKQTDNRIRTWCCTTDNILSQHYSYHYSLFIFRTMCKFTQGSTGVKTKLLYGLLFFLLIIWFLNKIFVDNLEIVSLSKSRNC